MGQRRIAAFTTLTLLASQTACSDGGTQATAGALTNKSPYGSVEFFFCQISDKTDTSAHSFHYSFLNSSGMPYQLNKNRGTLSALNPESFSEDLEIRLGISLGKTAKTKMNYKINPTSQSFQLNRGNGSRYMVGTFVFSRRLNEWEGIYKINTPNVKESFTAKANCKPANYPFRLAPSKKSPYSTSRSFETFFNQNYEWGTGIKGRVITLGKCIDTVEPSDMIRRLKCREGYAESRSPMGTKVCTVNEATFIIYAKDLDHYTPKGSKMGASLEECRWRD